MDEVIIDAMREKFGDAETDDYIRLAKAVRALVAVWQGFVEAEIGSMAETMCAAEIEQMMDKIKSRPEHGASLIEGLVAIIMHMRMGGTYEDWFTTIGLAAMPGED